MHEFDDYINNRKGENMIYGKLNLQKVMNHCSRDMLDDEIFMQETLWVDLIDNKFWDASATKWRKIYNPKNWLDRDIDVRPRGYKECPDFDESENANRIKLIDNDPYMRRGIIGACDEIYVDRESIVAVFDGRIYIIIRSNGSVSMISYSTDAIDEPYREEILSGQCDNMDELPYLINTLADCVIDDASRYGCGGYGKDTKKWREAFKTIKNKLNDKQLLAMSICDDDKYLPPYWNEL